jgi:hypothetical protein
MSRKTIGLVVAAVLWTMGVQGTPAAGGRSPAPLDSVQVRPEYERALKRIYLSVPDEYRGPREAAVDPHRHVQFVQHTYAELIASLPNYTNIDIAVSDRPQATLVEGLRAAAGARPFRVHVIDRLHADLDMWAQDLGERISVNGEDRFLVPMPTDPRMPYNGELSQSRQRVARQVFADRTVEADFVFEGGNLAFDRVGDRTRVFIGYNDVQLTIENYRRQGRSLDADGVARLVAADFGGAEVVVMGRQQQSPLLFHLDQAFILLGDNLAVVNRIVGPASPEQRQLDATRERLKALGYRTVVIDHTQADVEGYRVSTNAVPFVDAETGQKTIIFPVFPGEAKDSAQGPLGPGQLTGKALAAYRAYQAAGYLPIPIRDFAHIVGGNTHCITNVLN